MYIAAPDTHLVVVEGRLQRSQTERVNFARPSIDVLFESLARYTGGGRSG